MSIRLVMRARESESSKQYAHNLNFYSKTITSYRVSDYLEDHILVYWPNKDSVSVVHTKYIIEPNPPIIGESCLVKTLRKMHSGVIAEIGKLNSALFYKLYSIQL